MALNKTQTPERLIVVWEKGVLKGASVQHIESIEDAGVVISSRYLDPVPLDATALAALLNTATNDALSANSALTAQVAQLTADRDAAVAELAALKQSLQPTDANGVPQRVTRFQARAALHLAGLLATVDAVIADPATDAMTKLAWADAQTFERTSPTVAGLSVALGLTAAQLDALFVQAAAIRA